MSTHVLDSFALIAYLRDEPGAKVVEDLLIAAGRADRPLLMSEVNYAEVKFCLLRKHGASTWREVERTIAGLPIRFFPATRAHADQAAEFKSRFKLSLADAFAAALAKSVGAELVTGDREFAALASHVAIRWLK